MPVIAHAALPLKGTPKGQQPLSSDTVSRQACVPSKSAGAVLNLLFRVLPWRELELCFRLRAGHT